MLFGSAPPLLTISESTRCGPSTISSPGTPKPRVILTVDCRPISGSLVQVTGDEVVGIGRIHCRLHGGFARRIAGRLQPAAQRGPFGPLGSMDAELLDAVDGDFILGHGRMVERADVRGQLRRALVARSDLREERLD